MTQETTPVVMRELDWTAEVKRVVGKDWEKPEVEYEFSNGRKFVINPGDVYRTT